MSEFGEQIIFKALFERHEQVRMPMIQRDYAQGRKSQEEVRTAFLNVLHDKLRLPADSPELPLNLDFIYGSAEEENGKRFLPLDGQQRLTTLFLIHWYAAWMDDQRSGFKDLFCIGETSRFAYSVRPSSTEFFDALVNFWPECSPNSVESVSGLVANQSWYFRYWRLDPTIQSVLCMLDAIHERFVHSSGLFERLINTEQPAVTFQLLPLENFGLNDDLYIKMNARGKPLTAFETFKARFEQELKGQFEDNETRSIGTEHFPVPEFFSRRMDTTWADFFWEHRNKETNVYDDAVMNLFRAVILITRDPEQSTSAYHIEMIQLRHDGNRSSYAFFDKNKWLDRSFSETLILLLETWCSSGVSFQSQLPNSEYFDEVAIYKKAVSDPTNLSYLELVQLSAYLAYLRQNDGAVDIEALQEWMRIVFNLTTNTSYDRANDMQRSIAGILEIAENSSRVLEYFAESEKAVSGFAREQIEEEQQKAELLLSNREWRPLIHRAERHGYFKGQVEFLIDFSGAVEQWELKKCADWAEDEHRALQNSFKKYLEIAELMFYEQGLSRRKNFQWQRAFLCVGDYLLPSGRQNHSFLVNKASEQGSWKRLLRGTGDKASESRKLLQNFWDRLEATTPISEQLNAIIEGTENLRPWRKAFIDHPEAIGYCSRRSIRWNSANEIYLLEKSQMNGAHAELFTYCLYKELLQDEDADRFAPLGMDYYYSKVTEEQPGIRYTWRNGFDLVYFDVEWHGARFLVYKQGSSDEESFVDFVTRLEEDTSFKVKNNRLQRNCTKEEVAPAIQELSNYLKRYSQEEKEEE